MEKIYFKKKILPIHSTSSGSKFTIDCWIYSPKNPKRINYLQAGLHGVELTGIPVLMKFIKEVEKNQLNECFICIPWANPMGIDSQIMGLQTGYNNLHTNQQNCLNWNRISNLKNELSIEGRWINTLLRLSKKADLVVDLHCAGLEMIPHIYVHESQSKIAMNLGVPHILLWNNPSNSFSDFCFTRGQSALTFELSSSRIINDKIINKGLNYLKFLFGIKNNSSTSMIWNSEIQLKKFYSPQGGIICWHKNAGDKIRKGEKLFTLFSRNNTLKVNSPYDSILMLKNPIHAPHQYQELAKFLVF